VSDAPENDWEYIFEDPAHGLITLISKAKSSDGLEEICTLLVEFLFKRATDHDVRDEFRFRIKTIFAMGMSRDDTIDDVIDLLREIKDDRLERSGQDRTRAPASIETEHEGTAADVFGAMLVDEFATRFAIMRDGVTFQAAQPVPFLLSDVFARMFVDLVREEFAPEMADLNRGLITRAERLDIDARSAFFEESMRNRAFRARLIKDWDTVWGRLTQQQPLPLEPPEEAEQSLLSKLMGKGAGPASTPEQAHEDWLVEVERITFENERASRICTDLFHDTSLYEKPKQVDIPLLGGLFSRSHEVLQRQITAVIQLATQGGTVRAFEEYQKGKDLDLALLVASYRYPSVFLRRDKFLFEVLRGYPEALRKELFPLVDRFLIDD
jgi:hypothetical protein